MTAQFPNMAHAPQPGPKPNGQAHGPTAGKADAPVPPPLPAPAQPMPPHAWKYGHLIRRAGDRITQHRVDFPDLSRAVRVFLTQQIGQHTRHTAPRMLWVQGKPGEGKSETSLAACMRAGFDVAVPSTGMFAGEVEGASVHALHDLMAELVHWSVTHRVRVVVLINDFDRGIANVEEDTGKTVNTPLLVQELMSLADNRNLYRNVDGSNIGIIFTVNDATRIDEALTRLGRSTWHDHVPTTEDKANIAFAVLQPATSAERDLVASLVAKFAARQPVTFWPALRDAMQALHTRSLTDDGMPNQAEVDAAYAQRLPLKPEIAWAAAKHVRQAKAKNWLTNRTRTSWWGR